MSWYLTDRMFRGFFLAVLVLLCMPSIAAAGKYGPLKVSGSVDLFHTRYSTDSSGLFNPDNAIAQLPSSQFYLLLKPKFGLDLGAARFWIGPRLGIRNERINGVRHTSNISYLQEMGLHYSFNDQFSVTAERNVLLWGPSLFSSPSNPFFASSNQNNPFIELNSRDFVRARYMPDTSWAMSLIANVKQGRDDNEYATFRPIVAVSLEHTGEAHAVNLIAAHRSGLSHLGFFGQWTASDAMLLYTDLGLRSRTDARIPERDNSIIGWRLRPRGNRNEYDGVIGLSYTPSSGDTLAVEYRHNSQGLNSSENTSLGDLAGDAINAAANPLLTDDAVNLLGSAADLKMRSLRRNYVHVQYLIRELTPDLGINLLAIHNLDDHGTQWIGVGNYYLNSKSRLSLNLVANSGDKRTEFRRFFDRGFFFGFKYFY